MSARRARDERLGRRARAYRMRLERLDLSFREFVQWLASQEPTRMMRAQDDCQCPVALWLDELLGVPPEADSPIEVCGVALAVAGHRFMRSPKWVFPFVMLLDDAYTNVDELTPVMTLRLIAKQCHTDPRFTE